MSCDRCVWGKWFKNRLKSQAWFRVCKRCGVFEHAQTEPEAEGK
jgi:uncharacterized protein (DUF983 family)